MKLKYEKPMMITEEFTPNNSVAYCTNQYNTQTWNPQTVKCVISSSDNIFGSTNCTADGYTVVDAGTLTYVEGEGYFFIWSKTNSGGDTDEDDKKPGGQKPGGQKPGGNHSLFELTGEAGLKTILEAAGLNTDQWMNYHAGPVVVTNTTVSKQNWSL